MLFIVFNQIRDFLLLFIILFVLIYLMIQRNKKFFYETLIVFILALCIPFVIKILFPSLRPMTWYYGREFWGSFPSSHTTIAFSLAFLFLSKNLILGLIFTLFSIWIAILSITSLAHRQIDVLTGIIIALLINFVLYSLNRFYTKYQKIKSKKRD